MGLRNSSTSNLNLKNIFGLAERKQASDLHAACALCPSEVSPVWPGLRSLERETADHLLPQRVVVGRLQLWPLPAGWRRTGRQVPGGGTGPARLHTFLWERGALPGGMGVEMVSKWPGIQMFLQHEHPQGNYDQKLKFETGILVGFLYFIFTYNPSTHTQDMQVPHWQPLFVSRFCRYWVILYLWQLMYDFLLLYFDDTAKLQNVTAQ